MAPSHNGGHGSKRRGAQTPQKSLVLPENLGARCSVLYVWDEEYTIRALEGYLQFMELKTNFEDWDAETLAPSVVIDLVWQQHLLYNKQYYKACVDYCGEIIGYDPEASLFKDHLQESKVRTTQIALKALYGRNFDEEVWSFQPLPSSSLSAAQAALTVAGRGKGNSAPVPASTNNNNNNNNTQRESREEIDSGIPAIDHANSQTSSNANNQIIRRDDTISDSEPETSDKARSKGGLLVATSRDGILPKNNSGVSNSGGGSGNGGTGTRDPGESVTVKIKCFVDGKTQDTCIRVKRTTKMKKVEDCLARLMNLEGSESVRFLVDGEQVSPWETLESMKVIDPEQHWFTVMPKVSAYQ